MKIDSLINIGFTLPTATDLSTFFASVGYVANIADDDLVTGFVMPSNKVVVIDSDESLAKFLKADTLFYKDIQTILAQKGNTDPNRSEVKRVIVYCKTVEKDFGEAFEALVAQNANFAQVCISSRTAEDILLVASKAVTADRLFEAQTSDAGVLGKAENNVAKTLAGLNNDSVKLTFHNANSEFPAGGIMSIQSGDMLGEKGDIYSKITQVTPQKYSATEESNLIDQNVSFYTSVNPINGGGIEQYATNIYYGGKMMNGENAKRRRIRYYLDKILKTRCLDFLAKKLSYQDVNGALLESMLSAVFLEAQSNDLIVQNSSDTKGFKLNVLSLADVKKYYNTQYIQQCYIVQGWYIDALTAQKVDISLTVDPTEAEKLKMERA